MKQSEELQIAIEAAKIGAKVGLKYFDKEILIEKKADQSVVSIADREAEEEILKFILSQDKKAKFLAEESGGNIDGNSLWLVDPIDGSRCYSRGLPFWCTLISRYKDNDIKLAACYFPVMQDGLSFAERGKGAYSGDRKIHVSGVSSFDDAFLTFGSLRHFNKIEPLMRIVNMVHGIRGYEPTYSSTMIAQGKVDINLDVYAYPWDSAPFKVMVEEAGGKITMPDGSPWNIHGRGFIATNGILHDEVIKLYNG